PPCRRCSAQAAARRAADDRGAGGPRALASPLGVAQGGRDRELRARDLRPRRRARRSRLRPLAPGLSELPRPSPVRPRPALIVPIRLLLAVALFAAGLAGDTRDRSVVLAFLVGAFVLAFAVVADRRRLLLRKEEEPRPLPADAVREPAWRVAVAASLPS